MLIQADIQRAICAMFEVHQDESGVQRIVTPLEYPGTNDRIVVRVRPQDGDRVRIDENGEAAFYAAMDGGDIESGPVLRWLEEMAQHSPVRIDDEVLFAEVDDERLIAPYIIRVAQTAHHLHALMTQRAERSTSDFKERVREVIREVATELEVECEDDAELPISGAFRADHLLRFKKQPLVVITATSATRLLEAGLIYSEYRRTQRRGYILAIAESQTAVGRTQFERAGYFTDRVVVYDRGALRDLIAQTH